MTLLDVPVRIVVVVVDGIRSARLVTGCIYGLFRLDLTGLIWSVVTVQEREESQINSPSTMTARGMRRVCCVAGRVRPGAAEGWIEAMMQFYSTDSRNVAPAGRYGGRKTSKGSQLS